MFLGAAAGCRNQTPGRRAVRGPALPSGAAKLRSRPFRGHPIVRRARQAGVPEPGTHGQHLVGETRIALSSMWDPCPGATRAVRRESFRRVPPRGRAPRTILRHVVPRISRSSQAFANFQSRMTVSTDTLRTRPEDVRPGTQTWFAEYFVGVCTLALLSAVSDGRTTAWLFHDPRCLSSPWCSSHSGSHRLRTSIMIQAGTGTARHRCTTPRPRRRSRASSRR